MKTQTPTTESNDAAATKTANPAKRETKRDQLVKMLRRKAGADVPADLLPRNIRI